MKRFHASFKFDTGYELPDERVINQEKKQLVALAPKKKKKKGLNMDEDEYQDYLKFFLMDRR